MLFKSDNSGCTTSDTIYKYGFIGTQSINQQLTQFSPNPLMVTKMVL